MITTSRYASEETRKLARRIADRLGTFYTSRGKKTIDSIVSDARKKGEHEILVVEEEDGKPVNIAVIEVSELGEWKWTKRMKVDEYEG
jgi:rRNA maturation protein Rpf1